MGWTVALLVTCLAHVGLAQNGICDAGEYWDTTVQDCVYCAIRFFKSVRSADACTECPSGTSTIGEATTSRANCLTICPPGNFYQTASGLCQECSHRSYAGSGTFSNGAIRTLCEGCPTGQITAGTGSTSDRECTDPCGDGEEVVVNNGIASCQQCQLGYYRAGSTLRCQQCPAGQSTLSRGATQQSDCVFVCPPGQYRIAANSCNSCPVATYQDQQGQTECNNCPTGTTTKATGSQSSADCLTPCQPGSALDSANVCRLCPRGYYQAASGLIEDCTKCSGTLTTALQGSTSSGACIPTCQAGNRRDTQTGACSPCSRGTYQNQADQDTCVACPLGFTTLQTGSTIQQQCIAQCAAGNFRNTNGVCEACRLGFYQSSVEQTACTQCPQSPIRTTTRNTGATNSGVCVPICLAGSRITGNTCTACQLGYYQSQEEQPTCTQCTNGKTTLNTRSTSASDCVLFCDAGQYPNGDQCSQCPIGTYKNSRSRSNCVDCGEDRTTLQTGSTSIDQCVPICPAGQFLNGRDCANCLRNTYQANRGQTTCSNCVSGFITANEGSTSPNDCFRSCNVGEEVEGTTCRQCQIGFYQDQAGQKQCKRCPDTQQTTLAAGATREADCLIVCRPGHRLVNNQCERCPVNTFQPNQGTSSCNSCPANTQTYGVTAATNANQCIETCNPGLFRSGSSCQLCPHGTYQEERGQITCNQCPNNLRTLREGSISASDCVFTCPPGQQQVSGQQVCQDCAKGLYKETYDLSNCLPCPTGRTTSGVGSILESNCSLAYCPPGSFSRTATCEPCQSNTFQEQAGQHSCEPCPSNRVYTGTGATSRTQCLFSCAAGSEPLPGNVETCRPCPIGTFKSSSGIQSCTACDAGWTTGTTGASTSASCNIRVCSAGYRREPDTNLCVPCGEGRYQPLPGQVHCISCPTGFTTRPQTNGEYAATSAADCRTTNECSVDEDNCHANADCIDRDDGFDCRCKAGFVGDGVNSCVHQCDEAGYCFNGGTCLRTDLGAVCNCAEGFTSSRCQDRTDEEDALWKYIVGGVFGGFAFLLLLVGLVLICYRCCRKEPNQNSVVVMQKQPAATYAAPSYIAAGSAKVPLQQPIIQSQPVVVSSTPAQVLPQQTLGTPVLPNYRVMQTTPTADSTREYFSGI